MVSVRLRAIISIIRRLQLFIWTFKEGPIKINLRFIQDTNINLYDKKINIFYFPKEAVFKLF